MKKLIAVLSILAFAGLFDAAQAQNFHRQHSAGRTAIHQNTIRTSPTTFGRASTFSGNAITNTRFNRASTFGSTRSGFANNSWRFRHHHHRFFGVGFYPYYDDYYDDGFYDGCRTVRFFRHGRWHFRRYCF